MDFAIWLLFHRIYRTSCKPAHILCHGYQRSSGPIADDDQGALLGIPGIVLHYPNSHVGTLKSRPWSDLLNLLGKDGEQIMLDLILNCAVYAGVESGKGNFYQLSGMLLLQICCGAAGLTASRSSDDRSTAPGGEEVHPSYFSSRCWPYSVESR